MTTISKSAKVNHTLLEQRSVAEHIEKLLDLLDDKSINELFSACDRDMNKIWDILYEETYNILYFGGKELNQTDLNYLPNLKAGYEEYLRKANLNYFVSSTLPDFEMNWHCFGKGTEVRMYDGSIKNIEDIRVGNRVMGPDSTPRNVLKIHKGIDELYNIKSVENTYNYVVNSLHDVVLFDEQDVMYKDTAPNLQKNLLFKRNYAQKVIKKEGSSRVNIDTIESLGRGEYFGFECDGDHLFLLKDGMVVSNCCEWFQMIQLYQYLCVIASRDHSKSYSFSFATILWKMYRYEKATEFYNPSLEVRLCKEGMLITNEYKLAKRLIKKIRREVEDNPILRERLYPGAGADGWANESLTCSNGAELTLSSYRSPNRGPHPGYIVVDDFLDKSCLYSKEARDRFHEVFQAEIMNMILPKGQVLCVGTPFHSQDLYSQLKLDPSWKVFEYPAIFPDGRVLWESRYDYDALIKKRKSLGNLIFSREILTRPISDSISIFPYNILEISFMNMQSISLASNRDSYPIKMKKVSLGCDFALSGSAKADYSVFSVWGIDNMDSIHLMHLVRLHGSSYNEQLSYISQIANDFNPEVIVMETNGFQKVMAQMAKDRGMRSIIEFNTNGFNKKDLYTGLPSLAVLFETGIIKLPRGNAESIATTDMLCHELNSMAFDGDSGKLESISGHDDISMSMFFAIKGLKTVHSDLRISYVE